jgi:predicted glycoside hydrolase/deacetylase ChbG (UPF0249 family)
VNPETDTIPKYPTNVSPLLDTRPSDGKAPHGGLLIINADDWGRDRETTDRILDCVAGRTVSSVSAMVFMADSERAAATAQESGIDAGLHLNFTAPFSARDCQARLAEHQRHIASYLLRHPLARVIFHPGLVRSFEYVVAAQLDEFHRLYGADPDRIDGHHHLHLCANVLFQRLLPVGVLVRRNFSFQPGERSLVNRLYRKAVDRELARRHRLLDFLFSLAPFAAQDRLERILSLARQFVVEVETHPICPDEYRFLLGDEILRLTANIRVAPPSAMSRCRTTTPE